jgi:monoamine oxidase
MKSSGRRRKPHRVLVIGSGMSGLACARELQQRGYEVLVIEARSRVGGRLKGGKLRVPINNGGKANAETGEHAVDLGGALIHGIDENPLYMLAQELGITTRSVQECLLMDSSGWPVDPKQDEKAQHVFDECLEESFRRIQEARMGNGVLDGKAQVESSPPRKQQNSKSVSASTRSRKLHCEISSFGDVFETVCAEKRVDALPALLQWHQANLEVSCGASFDRLGWDWNEDEPYGFDGEHHALKDSWNSVTGRLAETLDILFESTVTHIRLVHPDPVELAKHRKKLEKVEQQRQQLLRASVSPSKSVSTKNPDVVPVRASRRIRGEEVDVRRSGRPVRKAVDRFVVDHTIPQVLSSPLSKNRKRAHSSTGQSLFRSESYVQVTVKQPSGHMVELEAEAVVCTLPLGILKQDPYEGGVTFDPPLPQEKQIAIQRLGTGLLNKCALSFDRIFWQNVDFIGWAESDQSSYLVLNGAAYTGGKPILIFMYGGNFAKDIQDWTDQQIVEDCMKVLQKLCGRRTIPRPLDYCVTRWGKDPRSRMAFSYIPPGVDGFAELRNMSKPIYGQSESFGEVPLLMFAGEHTTPFHPSTIHGAFLSGIREAYRLDSVVCADAFENFQFSEDDLYQHTFTIGKHANENGVQDNKDSSDNLATHQARSATLMTNREHVTTGSFHRRRGASGVMRLSRHDEIASTPDTNGKHGEYREKVKSEEKDRPQRRLRAAFGLVSPGSTTSEANHEENQAHAASIKDLEDRTLMRSLESYGADYEYIQEVSLPVYGAKNDRKSNLTQIQARCHKLVKSSQLRPPSRPRAAIMKNWIAKHVADSKGKSCGSTPKKAR